MRNRDRQRENRRMKRILEQQKCACSRSDCKSCNNGYCRSLHSTDFGGKPCPFFKTKEQMETEQSAVLARLTELGRHDLIEKYYGGENRGYQQV